jgi:hypothetical protein
VEARVVPRPEQVRAAEVDEVVGERAHRRDEVVVVACAVRLEPVAIVVGLELAQELERLGWEAAERWRYGTTTTGAIVTGLWTV